MLLDQGNRAETRPKADSCPWYRDQSTQEQASVEWRVVVLEGNLRSQSLLIHRLTVVQNHRFA